MEEEEEEEEHKVEARRVVVAIKMLGTRFLDVAISENCAIMCERCKCGRGRGPLTQTETDSHNPPPNRDERNSIPDEDGHRHTMASSVVGGRLALAPSLSTTYNTGRPARRWRRQFSPAAAAAAAVANESLKILRKLHDWKRRTRTYRTDGPHAPCVRYRVFTLEQRLRGFQLTIKLIEEHAEHLATLQNT